MSGKAMGPYLILNKRLLRLQCSNAGTHAHCMEGVFLHGTLKKMSCNICLEIKDAINQSTATNYNVVQSFCME